MDEFGIAPMSRLRRALWWSTTAPLATAGGALAFVLLGAGGALLLVGLGTGGAALVRWQLQQSPGRWDPWPALLSVLGGWGLLAVVGLVAEFGAAGLAASAALVAARALPLHRLLPGGRGEDGHSDPGNVPVAEVIPGDPLPQPAAVPTLSTPELCWAWRLSYARVQRRDCPAYQRAHLAALRSACLDELEHRDPAAFSRWLPTARAGCDPARFFCPRQHH